MRLQYQSWGKLVEFPRYGGVMRKVLGLIIHPNAPKGRASQIDRLLLIVGSYHSEHRRGTCMRSFVMRKGCWCRHGIKSGGSG
jgi:hypothetical protein